MVSETALALVLLIGATMLIRSFFYLRDTAPGFRADGLLTRRASTPPYEPALEKARAIPGVSFGDARFHAAARWRLPIHEHADRRASRSRARRTCRFSGIASSRPIISGRSEFRCAADARLRRRTGTAVIVNETMARRFWPGQDAIGKHVGPLEIVGVAADVRIHDATKEGLLEVYFPYAQEPQPSMTLAIRGNRSLAPAIARVFGDAKVADMLAGGVGTSDSQAPHGRPDWRVRRTGAGARGCRNLRCPLVHRDAAHA